MNHPVIMQANAQVRYDSMLEAAETRRRVKRLQSNDLALRTRHLSFISVALSDIFGRLNPRPRTGAEVGALND